MVQSDHAQPHFATPCKECRRSSAIGLLLEPDCEPALGYWIARSRAFNQLIHVPESEDRARCHPERPIDAENVGGITPVAMDGQWPA